MVTTSSVAYRFRLSLGRLLPSIACVRLAEILRSGREISGWYEDGFGGFAGVVVTPVGLEEDGVYLL